MTARQRLDVPAMLLLCMGAIGALTALIGLVAGGAFKLPPELEQQLRSAGDGDPSVQDAVNSYLHLIEMATKAARPMNLISLLINGVMIAGAWKMRQQQMFGLAVVSAIIGCLPIGGCCCCLGLPVGIWALTVLYKPDVRSAFTS